MINLEIILKYGKIIGVFVLIIIFYGACKEYQFQKAENARQTENIAQLIKSDSLHYSSQLLTDKELRQYLEFQHKELKKKLAEFGVKESRIKEITHTDYYYKDTVKRETDITGLVESIKNSIPKSQEWIDTTKCMTTKGIVSFDGQKLKVIVNDREFKNKTDAVAYWERRQWNFLGIKTRFLGKKQFTAKVFDECGESRILKIEKKD